MPTIEKAADGFYPQPHDPRWRNARANPPTPEDGPFWLESFPFDSVELRPAEVESFPGNWHSKSRWISDKVARSPIPRSGLGSYPLPTEGRMAFWGKQSQDWIATAVARPWLDKEFPPEEYPFWFPQSYDSSEFWLPPVPPVLTGRTLCEIFAEEGKKREEELNKCRRAFEEALKTCARNDCFVYSTSCKDDATLERLSAVERKLDKLLQLFSPTSEFRLDLQIMQKNLETLGEHLGVGGRGGAK